MSRIDAISPHHKSHIIASHQTSDIPVDAGDTERRSSWAEFLGRIGEISPHHTSRMIASHQIQAERREHKEEVLGPSSWAGWLTTPHHTHHISPHHTLHAERREHREEVVGPSSWAG